MLEKPICEAKAYEINAYYFKCEEIDQSSLTQGHTTAVYDYINHMKKLITLSNSNSILGS
jgi:predicted amidophosphoribosyltransferase